MTFPIFPANSAPTGYNLTRSLRFRASASAYLNRTLGTPTDSKKFTYSTWMKRGKSGGSTIFGSFAGDEDNFAALYFNAADQILYYDESGNTGVAAAGTAMVFRDFSAWYHIVFVVDTTQATAANRMKFYVNGVQVSFSASTQYGLNDTTRINFTGRRMQINATFYNSTLGDYFDGYLAETYFIDGQALTPASFGETNALTGVWQPKAYTGTYGTNGFYLDFETTTSVAALGNDKSGNGNTWTVNNVSLTAGVTYDSMTDVPTLTSATVSNFPVLSPIDKSTNWTLSDGNLKCRRSTGTPTVRATFALPSSGKYYFEYLQELGTDNSNAIMYGLCSGARSLNAGVNQTGDYSLYVVANSFLVQNGVSAGNIGTIPSVNQIVQVAVDVDNSKMWFGINNSWYIAGGATTGDPATGANPTLTGAMAGLFPMVYVDATVNTGTVINFGQRPFTYTPPTGFLALNTFNLPTSTILKGNTVMDATTYTGTLLSNTITNAGGFQPDLVWIKSRSAATDHKLTDSVRGVTKSLTSSSDAAEATDVQGLTAFNSGGFTVGTDTTYNNLAATYVAWQWKANGTAVSNTSGTITSQVNANPTAGFSIVTYTGNGTAGATIGHGLGVAPSVVIYKIRSASVLWVSYYKTLGATGFLSWSRNIAFTVDSTVFNNTAPTSSVLSVGTSGGTNSNTNTYVAYCFAPIDGYSAFLQYTGNGSTDGTFVYCGFKPKYIMIKRSDSTPEWYIEDAARNPSNPTGLNLYTNLANAEANDTPIFDFLSNGFKLRTSATALNASGGIYQCMVFAENPFKNSLAR